MFPRVILLFYLFLAINGNFKEAVNVPIRIKYEKSISIVGKALKLSSYLFNGFLKKFNIHVSG